jgi:hypothetical protein
MMQIDEEVHSPEWAKEIMLYLKNGQLLGDKESRKVKMQSARYTLIGDILYKRGYTLPFIKCPSQSEVE